MRPWEHAPKVLRTSKHMRSALGSRPRAPSAHLDIQECIMGGHGLLLLRDRRLGGMRLSSMGRLASTSWICGRVIREGLMASMSVTACRFWLLFACASCACACIGEAHLVLVMLPLALLLGTPPEMEEGKTGLSAGMEVVSE